MGQPSFRPRARPFSRTSQFLNTCQSKALASIAGGSNWKTNKSTMGRDWSDCAVRPYSGHNPTGPEPAVLQLQHGVVGRRFRRTRHV